MFQFLGLFGGFICLTAYLPQIIRLLKIKDSTGISIWSWWIWFLGTLMILSYAISIRDYVFITLETLFAFFILIIISLAYLYRRKDAPPH